jgi:hypothetical protein
MILIISDFRLSRWFIDVYSELGCLHRVDVSSVADVSEVHAAAMFRVKVSRVGECSYMYLFWSKTPMGGKMETGSLSGSVGWWTGKSYQMALFMATWYTRNRWPPLENTSCSWIFAHSGSLKRAI